MPGASRLITCRPRAASSRSNGAASSRLAPRPVTSSSGRPVPRTDVRSRTSPTSTERISAGAEVTGPSLSREGRDAGDVAADDQPLDSLGALVGVDGLDVGHVPDDVEVQQDPVAPQQVPRLREHGARDRKSTRLNSSHANISYAV